MDKVVYILGAGFSAPLGIPVMRNFLPKSKDLFAEDPKKYAHFDHVFKQIKALSVAKNYYNTDLFNIEEILSILEMDAFVKGKNLKDEFIQYIINVVTHYTPDPSLAIYRPSNWTNYIFGRNKALSPYAKFTAELFRLKVERIKLTNTNGKYIYSGFQNEKNIQAKYSVLSLNYDLVLEKSAELINTFFDIKPKKIFFNKGSYDSSWDSCHLVKLHGCIQSGGIVPPTWAKGTHPEIQKAWKNALKLLSEANHIRFIGYSLPESDSYIKYLLKSASLKTVNLKSLDVICLDSNKKVKSRYDSFFEHNNYRFSNRSTLDYLNHLHPNKQIVLGSAIQNEIEFKFCEERHESFMQQE